jgi:protein-S-isoprenylcysteine O-methyltransferase Ste14
MSLRSRLILRAAVGLLLSGAMLFVPAGSLQYWQAWAFLAIVFSFIPFTFFYFYRHDRQLLERRLRSKENLREQRNLIRYLKPVFVLVMLLPGLDRRFGWSRMPVWVSIVADAALIGAFVLLFWVIKVNTFASRTIGIEPGQKVIDTGPYALVRHPMYSGSILLFISLPLALGSYVALPAFALLLPFYVLRLLYEEKFLEKEFSGYREYCQRTRYQLIPSVW